MFCGEENMIKALLSFRYRLQGLKRLLEGVKDD
jgi:hypothetical protein